MISSIAMMLLGAASLSTMMTPGVMAFVKDHHLTRYSVALVDLDGDKRPEALIYAMSTIAGGLQFDECGSGGCDLYVLSLTAAGYRQISNISIAARQSAFCRASRMGGTIWASSSLAVESSTGTKRDCNLTARAIRPTLLFLQPSVLRLRPERW
ncbi:hypothetical protein [Sphingomonas bacterium]|uniref:hypothetical protein n=1 Tax=Sphingomonas bacterium TaxID=1895847 RepID=UPI001575E1A9|nr:hypothetical protein [Sphingomonas bacterium]